MGLLTIDQEKCKRDGLCSAVCPVRIIEMKDEESFPEPVAGAEGLCISCGHCVSVCPHGAITTNGIKPDDCLPFRKELALGPEQTEHFLRSRRSIRVYKEEPVDRPTLAKLLDIARYAPSGHNLQPVHWTVFEKRDDLQRLAGLVVDWMRFMIGNKPEVAGPMHFDLVVAAWEAGQDRVLRGAPHLMVAHGQQAFPPAQTACTIALTYLEIAAPSLGLGTCWAGYFGAAAIFYPPLIKELGLPEGHLAYGAMMVGYPKFRYQRLPPRNEPKIAWR